MFRITWIMLVFGLVALQTRASVVTYGGFLNPNNPNDIFITEFGLPFTSELTIQTYSYGGGVARNGQTTLPGSFDPVITLFAGQGPQALFPGESFWNDDGSCPPANVDPGTQLCLDSVLHLPSLPAGTYTVVLSVAGNIPIAVANGYGILDEGFTRGGFFDEPPVTRFLFDVETNPVPEPATFGSVGLVLIVSCLINSRRSRPKRADRTPCLLETNA